MKTFVGKAFKNRRDQLGARVRIEFDHSDGLSGVYNFGTHGKSAKEIKAERDRIAAHHRAKADRYLGFDGTVRGRTLHIAAVSWLIECCTIRERGTDVELVVIARNAAGEVVRIDTVYRDVESVPANPEIVGMMRDALNVRSNRPVVAKGHEDSIIALLDAESEKPTGRGGA